MTNKIVLKKIKQEGDRKEFKYKRYKCVIRRACELGHLCGYIGLPEGHKYYEKRDYDNIPYDVHGGWTFSEYSLPGEKKINGIWWIGFDCAHVGDLSPQMKIGSFESVMSKFQSAMLKSMTSVLEGQGEFESYKDMNFVEQELKNVVDEMKRNEKN